MDVRLIQVPYHLGRRDVSLAKGVPVLTAALAGNGVDVLTVERNAPHRNEIAACIDVIRGVARSVEEALASGSFPFVVAGNCSSALGTVAALGRGIGVTWFDAHGDFHTPDTTPTRFFDGMPLAMLTGAGWDTLRATVDGLVPVPEDSIALIGARALDAGERERLAASSIRRSVNDLDVSDVYVHVDLDVLDPSVARANSWAADGGVSLEELEGLIGEIGRRFAIRAAALTAYEPDIDPDGTVPPAARRIYERILAASQTGVAA